jgi:hypothetical protein
MRVSVGLSSSFVRARSTGRRGARQSIWVQLPRLSTRFPVALGWCGLLPAAAVENVRPIPSATPQLPYFMLLRLSPAPI